MSTFIWLLFTWKKHGAWKKKNTTSPLNLSKESYNGGNFVNYLENGQIDDIGVGVLKMICLDDDKISKRSIKNNQIN